MRYRFFLFAGLLPYLLGAAWASGNGRHFNVAMFWSGLGGVVLAVIGVEAYNEYFDARMGTDRVFNPTTYRRSPMRFSGSAPWHSPQRWRSAST